jgi:hypothetical protein
MVGLGETMFDGVLAADAVSRTDSHRLSMRTGLSRDANPSPSVGIKSAGKQFARARDRAAFFTRAPPVSPAETATAAPARAKVAECRGFLRRPQETRFAEDCVVGLAGLEPATTRLWRKHANSTSPRRLSHSITTGGITLSFAFLGALARRLGLST